MNEKRERRCESCAWYDEIVKCCRFGPPAAVNGWPWPVVNPDDWCRQWADTTGQSTEWEKTLGRPVIGSLSDAAEAKGGRVTPGGVEIFESDFITPPTSQQIDEMKRRTRKLECNIAEAQLDTSELKPGRVVALDDNNIKLDDLLMSGPVVSRNQSVSSVTLCHKERLTVPRGTKCPVCGVSDEEEDCRGV